MNSGFPLFRVFGTEVRLHWTWILLLAFVMVIFGEGLAGQAGSGLDTVSSWVTAAIIAALVLASVVAHELSHAAVAHRYGLGGNVVVVQLLGGAFLMDLRPQNAGEEFRVSIAGSAVSIALAVLFGAVAVALEIGWGSASAIPAGIRAAAFVVESIAAFNVFLAVVNMLPAYPLDGARIVHAVAWAATGQDEAATRIASRVGRWMGYGIILLGGVLAAFVDILPGLALAVIGWLLVGSSRVLDRRLVLRELVAGIRVSDAVDQDVSHLPPQLTLDVFASEYLGERFGAAALVQRGEELLGIIGTAQIRRVPQRHWADVRVEDAMVPVAAVPRTSGDSELWPALETLERSGLDGMLIAAGEKISAMLTRRSVALVVKERIERQARLAQVLQGRPWARGGRGRGPMPPPPWGLNDGGAGGAGGTNGGGANDGGNQGDGQADDEGQGR